MPIDWFPTCALVNLFLIGEKVVHAAGWCLQKALTAPSRRAQGPAGMK